MSNYQRIPIIPWSNPYGVGEIRMAKKSPFFMVKRPGKFLWYPHPIWYPSRGFPG